MSLKANEAYYDAFSESYDRPRHRGYHAYLDEAEVECIRDLLKGTVLEAGCGTGLIMKRIARGDIRVFGVDLSMGMLRSAVKRGLGCVQGDITHLPFEDNSFDLTYSFKVLAHVPHIRQAARELVRVTRPGGYIAAEFYNRYSFRFVTKALYAGTVARGVTERDVYLRFDTLQEFLDYFPKGVEVVRLCSARHCLMAPVVLNLPGVSKLAWKIERLLGATPLRHFGGFVTVVFKKTGR